MRQMVGSVRSLGCRPRRVLAEATSAVNVDQVSCLRSEAFSTCSARGLRVATDGLRDLADDTRGSAEEAIRTRECPGIYFADEPAGRVAKVAGTGLGVWEVIRDSKAARGNEKKLRKWLPHLSTAQLQAATVYHAKFPQEIDAEIADNIAAHAEGRAMQEAIARGA